MGLKLTGCDCRQPGFPRHTHTHPLDEHGQLLKDVEALKQVQRRKWRYRHRPFRYWPEVWLAVGLALIALKVWLEWHQQVEIEIP